MERQKFLQLMQKQKLPASLQQKITDAFETHFSIDLTFSNRPCKPGRSKIGGYPDLGPGLVWPSFTGGERPLHFILQINLVEIAELADYTGLPAKGMLYFFGGMEPVFKSKKFVPYAGTVLFAADDQNLQDTEAQYAAYFAGKEDAPALPMRIAFGTVEDYILSVESRESFTDNLTDAESNAYEAFIETAMDELDWQFETGFAFLPAVLPDSEDEFFPLPIEQLVLFKTLLRTAGDRTQEDFPLNDLKRNPAFADTRYAHYFMPRADYAKLDFTCAFQAPAAF